MNERILRPEWRYSPCKGKACFVSEMLVCIPFEDELSFFGLDGKKYGEPLYASLVCFAGPHLMAAFNQESMTVWSHSNRKLLCEGMVTCEGAEELTPCPWRKNVLSLRGPKQMVIMNLNLSKGDPTVQSKYCLERKTLMLKKDKNGKLKASSIGEVSLTSHCWLAPGDKLLVQTEREGMVQVDAFSLCCSGEVLRGPDEEIVRCMVAVEGDRIFAGFNSGGVQVIDISNGTWVVLETIDVRNVRWMSLSNSMKSILLTTMDGSVVHRHIKDGKNIDVVRKPMSETIGICPVGDGQCAVAGRDGSLLIYGIYDGKLVGEHMIGEDCESVAFSPLCNLVVLGTRSGFLHFVSAVDPRSPKVIHCDKPFSSPVSCLAFDRRGKLLVAGSAAMDSEHVHVFSGRPMFNLLVLVPMSGPVIDLSLNCEGTRLVALVKGEPGSAVLHWTYLPEDLLDYPTNYQANNFHTYIGDVETQRVIGLTSDVLGYHPKFGFFFHCEDELRRLLAFRNPDEDDPSCEPSSICEIKGRLSKLRISPDLLWLAFLTERGSMVVYKIGEDPILSIESPIHSFMEFSLGGDGFIAGDRNGGLSYFRLPPNVCEYNIIPECLYFCCCESIRAKHQLEAMEREFKFEEIKSTSFKEWQENIFVKKQLDMMFFMLKKLSLEQTEDGDLEDEESVLDDYIINELFARNLKKYLALGGSENEVLKSDTVNDIIAYSGCFVQNYPVPNKFGEQPQKLEHSEFNFFSSGMKLKTVEERLKVVQDIRRYIKYRRWEFNHAFNELYNSMGDSQDKISDLCYEMRVLCGALPSKSERDLWLAYVQHCEDENSLPELIRKPDTLNDQDGFEVDTTKRNIEMLSVKVSSLKKDFDSQVQHLCEQRRKCNVLIAVHELTNYCVLLYTIAEKELKKCQCLIKEKIFSQVVTESELSKILSDVEDLEKDYAQIFGKGFKLERIFEDKVRIKVDFERFYYLYFLPPSIPVNNFKEALSTEFSTEKPFPIDDKVWGTICKNRERRIKMELFLKDVESQTSDLIDIKFRFKERANTLEINQNRLRLYSSGLTTLLGKLSYTVHKLLTVDFACDREKTDIGILERCCGILNSRLKEFEEMFEFILLLIERDCKRCLQPLGELIDRLEKAKNVFKESKETLDILGTSKWSKMFRVTW